MKRIFSICFLMMISVMGSYAHAEEVVIESNYFALTQNDENQLFLSEEKLGDMDLLLDSFLTNFSWSLTDKVPMSITKSGLLYQHEVFLPPELEETVFIKSKTMLLNRTDGASIEELNDKAEWIGLKLSIDNLLEANLESRGSYGSLLIYGYPRYFFRDMPYETPLKEYIEARLQELVLDQSNFTLDILTEELSYQGDEPTEEEIKAHEKYFNETMFPLTMSCIDFIVSNFGIEKLTEFFQSDEIVEIFGVTKEQFETLWFEYAQSEVTVE